MNKKNLFFISIFAFCLTVVQAQVSMGKWRTHFAYNSVKQITQSENKIYAVSEGALFSVNKQDGGMEFYSKLTGLNGTAISNIEYDTTDKILLIIYSDGNIDFLSESGVKNLPDFYNKQMSADKGVNDIVFADKKAYLSCNFGIIILNMEKMEIQDTYYIGDNASEVKILNTTIYKTNIYATSTSNIYYASASDPQLINYESWKKLSGLPGTGNYETLKSFGDWLILKRGGKLYKMGTDNSWTNLETSNTFTGILVSGNYLLAFTPTDTYIFDSNLVKSQIIGVTNINDGVYDIANSKFWFAVNGQGVAEYQNTQSTPIISYYKPNGPAVNIPYKMRFGGQKLFVVQGGRWGSEERNPGIVMMYENNVWKNILDSDISSITGKKVLDFMNIAIDPADNKHFLISSYGNGIFEFKNDEFNKWHNFENNVIETIYPSNPVDAYLYMRMDGGVFDENGNAWFTNSSSSKAIKVYKKDGTWFGLGDKNIANKPTLGEILISNQNKNQKWILSVRYAPGIDIFDDNGTLEKTDDDKSVFYTSFTDTDKGGTISPLNYFCIAQDKNGVVWVGTNQGPLLFNSPSKAFDTGFTCSRVKIPRNDGTNSADYLLVDEEIKAIKIDGANRKWIGTKSSGAYLMSENGQETIQHFTTSNSPLLSNDILSIEINPVTGEVFFGTGNGLVSYQSDAAEAGDVFMNVHAFPNPVRENYNGVITIAGLVADTKVKITDLAGNLVFETTSNGSIATWNGKNVNGEKVSTGVYLAICVTADGTQSTITKILVIN